MTESANNIQCVTCYLSKRRNRPNMIGLECSPKVFIVIRYCCLRSLIIYFCWFYDAGSTGSPIYRPKCSVVRRQISMGQCSWGAVLVVICCCSAWYEDQTELHPIQKASQKTVPLSPVLSGMARLSNYCSRNVVRSSIVGASIMGFTLRKIRSKEEEWLPLCDKTSISTYQCSCIKIIILSCVTEMMKILSCYIFLIGERMMKYDARNLGDYYESFFMV